MCGQETKKITTKWIQILDFLYVEMINSIFP